MITEKQKKLSCLADRSTIPEKLRYSHYYEYDGALRAYANRMMLLSFITAIGFVTALSYAIYLRQQPPLVVRVDRDGYSSVIGKKTILSRPSSSKADAEPTEFEKAAFVRLFLDRYLNFSPTSVSPNWAEALNMMTKNLRDSAYTRMQKENLVGKIKDEHTRSEFELRSLDPATAQPLSYSVFGVRRIHRLRDGAELVDKVVSQFQIRLVVEGRSEENPSGLLIGEFWEKPIEGEARTPAMNVSPLETVRQ